MQSKNLIRVSAAGSGKTWEICKEALGYIQSNHEKKDVLILSYTNRGVEAIEENIKKQNNGALSTHIIVSSWYAFLLSDMIKPFQTYLFKINEIKSLDFSHQYGYRNIKRQGTRERYLIGGKYLLSNEASELALRLNARSNRDVINRLEEIYRYIFIDEIQDMAGYDLNIIEELMHSSITITCVGDNKQATFKTNNSRKNKTMSGKNVWRFFSEMQKKELVNIVENNTSRRFNKEICELANKIFPNGLVMDTSMKETTEHDGVFIICEKDVYEYYKCFSPTVLRYDSKTSTGGFPSQNFGECKGLTFERVLIYPNKPLLNFLLKNKQLSHPEKYYVAVTRPKYSLAFVIEKLPYGDDFLEVGIDVKKSIIKARKIKL